MPHLRSIQRILISSLACSVQLSIAIEQKDTVKSNARALRNRASDATQYGEIDVTGFPSCAIANCITSNQLSPSRLGCSGTPQLNKDCLCNKAPTPLSCVPSGPSDEENCWYEAEDWFAGACSGAVAEVKSSTIPQCMQDCVYAQIATMGCHNPTRNCFCILDRKPLLEATSSCLENCAKKMRSSFSPEAWRNDICKLGETDDYDQEEYDKYIKMVHDTRIAVPVVVVLFWLLFVTFSIICCRNGVVPQAVWTLIVATVLGLAIILPVEFAL